MYCDAKLDKFFLQKILIIIWTFYAIDSVLTGKNSQKSCSPAAKRLSHKVQWLRSEVKKPQSLPGLDLWAQSSACLSRPSVQTRGTLNWRLTNRPLSHWPCGNLFLELEQRSRLRRKRQAFLRPQTLWPPLAPRRPAGTPLPRWSWTVVRCRSCRSCQRRPGRRKADGVSRKKVESRLSDLERQRRSWLAHPTFRMLIMLTKINKNKSSGIYLQTGRFCFAMLYYKKYI